MINISTEVTAKQITNKGIQFKIIHSFKEKERNKGIAYTNPFQNSELGVILYIIFKYINNGEKKHAIFITSI